MQRLDMPFEDVVRSQRALRRLKPDPVPEDVLLGLLDLAIRAPSGTNKQNWDFVVVRDRAIVAEFARLNRQAFQLGEKVGYLNVPDGNPVKKRMVESVMYQAEHFHEIPVLIVPCLRSWIPPFPFIATSSCFGSIYPAVQNLLLAARAAGLGAALITVPLWNQFKAKRLLGLPWNVTPCCMIPLGYTDEQYTPNKRRSVTEVVHWDRYGRTGPAPT